jgi:hypothetical protein
MFDRLWVLIYLVVLWRARRLPRERGYSLRARWALRLFGVSSGGLDDDFGMELAELVAQMPALLDDLERRVSGDGHAARRKRLLLQAIRDNLRRNSG